MKTEIVIVTILIIIIFLVLTFLCSRSPREHFQNNTVSIAMCVPCYPPDTRELDQLMDSVRKLTVKPDEIIIGHSEMSPEEA